MNKHRPKTPVVKHGGLMLWLIGEGFTRTQVRSWLEKGVIPAKRIPGAEIRYYEVRQVAATLEIENPLEVPHGR